MKRLFVVLVTLLIVAEVSAGRLPSPRPRTTPGPVTSTTVQPPTGPRQSEAIAANAPLRVCSSGRRDVTGRCRSIWYVN